MDYGFQYIIDNGGITTEDNYSYTAKDGRCDSSKAKQVAAQITGFKDVPANNEQQLAAAVTEGPVSVAIEADQTAFQIYSGGVFDSTCGTKLDHGVLAVGYTDDYWMVKNSWGSTWGDHGYIYMKRGVGSTGICGIAMQPSYPEAGDSPGPTPPPGPTPSPGPTTGPYEDPTATGTCMDGELPAQIQGIDGEICLPKCTGVIVKGCPAVPFEVNASAACVLQTTSGDQYCGLECSPRDSTACNSALNLTCKQVQLGLGLCTYDS